MDTVPASEGKGVKSDDLEGGEVVVAFPTNLSSPVARGQAVNNLCSPIALVRGEASPNADWRPWRGTHISLPLTFTSRTIECNMNEDYALTSVECLVVQAAFEVNLPMQPRDGLGLVLDQVENDLRWDMAQAVRTFGEAEFNCSTRKNALRIASITFITATPPKLTSIHCFGCFVRSAQIGRLYTAILGHVT